MKQEAVQGTSEPFPHLETTSFWLVRSSHLARAVRIPGIKTTAVRTIAAFEQPTHRSVQPQKSHAGGGVTDSDSAPRIHSPISKQRIRRLFHVKRGHVRVWVQ